MGKIVKNTVVLSPDHNSNTDEVLQWVKQNCPSFISMEQYPEFTLGHAWRYYFIFGQETDMAWFALKWG